MSDIVDVVAVANRILSGGTRAETGVSNVELRALSRAVITIDRLSEDRSPESRRDARNALDTFAGVLTETGILERRHADPHP